MCYMFAFLSLISILQSFAISLGVGSSTLAITSFFVAISDGNIDDTERRMMGVVYIVLRVAMVLILVTTLIILSAKYATVGFGGMSAFHFGQIFATVVLFVNAMLMTAHIIPSNFGPAIQAGNWYTLGTLSALLPLGLTNFTFLQFGLAYVTWLVLAIGIVNGIMAILRGKRHGVMKKP
jgi:cytochrome c oxidase assembly factor CtaG